MSVVDASVRVALFLSADANHQAARSWFVNHLGSTSPTRVPALALPEVAGAISRRMGRTGRSDDAIARLRTAPRLEITPLDLARAWSARQIASTYGVRGAESVYAELARTAGDELVTFDSDVADVSPAS